MYVFLCYLCTNVICFLLRKNRPQLKAVVKVVLWSRGAHPTKQGWSKPHTHSNPTNLALFRHKITLYRFNEVGAHTIAGGGAQMGAGGLSPPGPLTLTTGWKLRDFDNLSVISFIMYRSHLTLDCENRTILINSSNLDKHYCVNWTYITWQNCQAHVSPKASNWNREPEHGIFSVLISLGLHKPHYIWHCNNSGTSTPPLARSSGSYMLNEYAGNSKDLCSVVLHKGNKKLSWCWQPARCV